MLGGLQSFCDEGVAPTEKCLLFVGALPPGRWVVVCEAPSLRGRRSYKKAFMQTSSGRNHSSSCFQVTRTSEIPRSIQAQANDRVHSPRIFDPVKSLLFQASSKPCSAQHPNQAPSMVPRETLSHPQAKHRFRLEGAFPSWPSRPHARPRLNETK